MKDIELLSPAGNFEKLKIALAYGADAVYAGVSHFSLRIRSGKEFTYESFEEAIKYTHERGKHLHATINGFPFNAQIPLLEKHIERVAAMNPDAFIVAAPGVIKLARKIAPHIPIHLSTQANVLNYLDAEVYADMGVKRIIAAREVSLKDLEQIKKHLPHLELEVFVHGSMCFAYSGRCLISSVQSGRVSNRGSCANDCRFPYTLYAHNEESGTLFRIEESEEGTHIMNAKDLNLSAHVKEILDSGVIDSLKIEGRTKSPYYVGITTKTYRQAIEDYFANQFVAEKYMKELDSTKNRGFSDGYLVNRPYEKNDTQNLAHSISEGTHQVVAQVSEDGTNCLCKDVLKLHVSYELVMPSSAVGVCVDNEIGTIFEEHGAWKILFKKLQTANGKQFDEIHSGNIHAIMLPIPVAGFSFLRLQLKDQE
ncbi:peptidase U32 family protein [Sulfurospirillum deleyianum]|uniref:Peptidase U32 n=1 Tax=Sulfurospirillum deleyianum (strain ATCC 51133 / DSM 6946 / 5175) TaxID=525898 RepID=D1B3K3_SULD5|nr:peptidase U32 family protein [Sulfurospirillum deleyianum]ACZ12673.1 peptidase U32 [Sulfurospirillum deleyianum DSM 6946]